MIDFQPADFSASELESKLSRLFPAGLSGLIFDCDGVLVDSCGANIGYYNKLLEAFGYPPVPKDKIEYVQMATAVQALELLFSPEDMKKLPDIAERMPYKSFALPLLKLEPGLEVLLRWLHGKGVRLGIHTNRGGGMWDLLDNFQLHGLFHPVMTVDVVQPKPSPEGVLRILQEWDTAPDRVAFIGDSLTDERAARGGSVPLIAYRSPRLEADVHVTNFPELHRALEKLPGLGPIRSID